MPLHMLHTSHWRVALNAFSRHTQVMPPTQAESVVVIATRPATRGSSSVEIEAVEPQLKPYQPTHRMKVPSTCSTDECPGIGTVRPELSKRPERGPTIVAPMSAHRPPVQCTTPEPAKSIMHLLELGFEHESQPVVDHTQWAITGYTKPVTIEEKTMYAVTWVRSASAPETMVDEVAA